MSYILARMRSRRVSFASAASIRRYTRGRILPWQDLIVPYERGLYVRYGREETIRFATWSCVCFLPPGKNYLPLSETPKVFASLDRASYLGSLSRHSRKDDAREQERDDGVGHVHTSEH